MRVAALAHICSAVIRLQIDIGFGDAITPEAEVAAFPALLDFPAPTLRCYPRETVVAEKLEAMVVLGQANSRMKDFYDVAILSQIFAFEGDVLVRAIAATFARRKTPLRPGLPIALTSQFTDDQTKRTQWAAFLRKSAAPNKTSLRSRNDHSLRRAADCRSNVWRGFQDVLEARRPVDLMIRNAFAQRT